MQPFPLARAAWLILALPLMLGFAPDYPRIVQCDLGRDQTGSFVDSALKPTLPLPTVISPQISAAHRKKILEAIDE
jgi:hypothetical protein